MGFRASGQRIDTLEAAGSFHLVKPSSSGDNQHDVVNEILSSPVRVQVLDSLSHAVAGHTVYFKILYQPKKSEGFRIIPGKAVTDSNGVAVAEVQLGDKPGAYEAAARIESTIDHDFQVFTFYARKGNWLLMLIFGLLGGLGLFLLGMEMMSEGMKKSAGDRLRTILGNLTRNRIMALGLGTFVTMVIQSSSAVSVMLVGFVNSKLMNFRRTIAIILGANIGTTVTAQLIAFQITDYALLMIAVGFGMVYFSKKQGIKYLGQAILGFGVLFYGMHVMSGAMYPLRTYDPIIDLLLKLENPLLGILVGAVFTALLQSSSAFIGIIIVLAGQGLLTLEAGIALLLGSNIGTAITAVLASIKASREAKKVALANVFVNFFGVVVFIAWIPAFAEIITGISPKSPLPHGDPLAMAETIPRQLANAHTFFNVAMALIILPVANYFSRIIDRMLPEKPFPEEAEMAVRFLDDRILSTPALGLNLAKEEALRVAETTRDMVGDLILPFLVKDKAVITEILQKEQLVDYLSEQINLYLTRIIRQSIESERADEAFQIMYTVKELEQIADTCTNLIEQKAQSWIEGKVEFSVEGKQELIEYHTKIQKQLSRAVEVFRDVNLEKARRMKEKHKKYRNLAADLEKQHYERLRDAGKTLELRGDTHMELMIHLRTIMSHATNIGRILIKWKTGAEG
jgi:phosphate:Na+ symporter